MAQAQAAEARKVLGALGALRSTQEELSELDSEMAALRSDLQQAKSAVADLRGLVGSIMNKSVVTSQDKSRLRSQVRRARETGSGGCARLGLAARRQAALGPRLLAYAVSAPGTALRLLSLEWVGKYLPARPAGGLQAR
jgi:hypothetical protein